MKTVPRPELGAVLRELEAPEHRPEFYAELHRLLALERAAAPGATAPTGRWVAPLGRRGRRRVAALAFRRPPLRRPAPSHRSSSRPMPRSSRPRCEQPWSGTHALAGDFVSIERDPAPTRPIAHAASSCCLRRRQLPGADGPGSRRPTTPAAESRRSTTRTRASSRSPSAGARPRGAGRPTHTSTRPSSASSARSCGRCSGWAIPAWRPPVRRPARSGRSRLPCARIDSQAPATRRPPRGQGGRRRPGSPSTPAGPWTGSLRRELRIESSSSSAGLAPRRSRSTSRTARPAPRSDQGFERVAARRGRGRGRLRAARSLVAARGLRARRRHRRAGAGRRASRR